MTKTERARKVATILDRLYPQVDVPLHHKDPYTLLIAVVLSAQCTDKRVNQITPALFSLADTPQKMVLLQQDVIRDIIRPCGLSGVKSRAILQLSHDLLHNHEGQVPPSIEELEKLPGVGHKTASVVVSQAFGIPAFAVDTHIHRCTARWGLSSGKNVRETERDLKELFPEKEWGKIHVQMIYFAREYCPARGHNSVQCPICSVLE